MANYNTINGIEYKEIESEEEYEKELSWFKDAIKADITHNGINPTQIYNNFMLAVDRAEGIGLFNKEYCDTLRKRVIDALHNQSLKERAKKFLKKRGLLK